MGVFGRSEEYDLGVNPSSDIELIRLFVEGVGNALIGAIDGFDALFQIHCEYGHRFVGCLRQREIQLVAQGGKVPMSRTTGLERPGKYNRSVRCKDNPSAFIPPLGSFPRSSGCRGETFR